MWKSLTQVGIGFGMMALAMTASASDQATPFQLIQESGFSIAEFQGIPESKFLPGKPRARVGEKQAASRAKRAFPNSKILSVNPMQGDGSYRVKLLSNGGVVKYVYVGKDGEVVE